MSTHTQQPVTPPAADQGTHFYMLALQIPTPTGFRTSSFSGTCTPGPGATRYDVYLDLRDEYARRYPECATAPAIHYDIQPNQL